MSQVHISPHIPTKTSKPGLSPIVLTASTFLTTSIPSTTFPNTTCLLFKNGVATVVMKNCDPFVLGPEFCQNIFYFSHLSFLIILRVLVGVGRWGGIITTYRHTQNTRSIMFPCEILIRKRFRAVNRCTPGSISIQEIPSLDHEIFNLMYA